MASLFIIQLTFKIFDLKFQSGGDFFATLDCKLFSFIQFILHVFDLAIQSTSVSFSILSIFLLSTQFISKTSGIDHCLLCFVLCHSGLIQHLLKISMHCLHFRVKLPLACLKRLVLKGAVCYLFHYIRQFLLSTSTLTIGMFQLSLCLFTFIADRVRPPLSLNQTFPCLVTFLLLLLQSKLGFLDEALVFLDSLLSLSIGSIGMFKGNIKLIQISFQLFLVPKSLSLGFSFIFQ